MATSNQPLINELVSVVQLDIDAFHAYQQAINSMDLDDVRAALVAFQRDHERHVNELSEVILSLGGEAPVFARDFKGFLIEGMTALRSRMGTEGALKAMRQNEILTNAKYNKAAAGAFPQHVAELLARGQEDERRHLDYIEKCIQQRVWDDAAAREALPRFT